jgi:glyoxylase-like metal-dependent hydrolase (beta-lactamase superfamily II)
MKRHALILALVPSVLLSQPNWDTITVKATPLRGGVHVITGVGGNIGLSVGSDAAFLVDDQFAPLTPKIVAAVAGVTSRPIRFVVNTHWHGDHTGGNENIGKAGGLIVAHDNVRRRMSVEQFMANNRRQPPAPAAALPVVTFTDSVTFHINGDSLVVFHVPPAHTDGDAIVAFMKANVIHMGDLFMTTSYPFVDLSSGGHVDGFVTAADRALSVCNAETMVIPGHGRVTDCEGLRAWRNMIATVRDRVREEMRRGRTLDQIKAAGLTSEFDERWGNGFIRRDAFVEAIHRSYSR